MTRRRPYLSTPRQKRLVWALLRSNSGKNHTSLSQRKFVSIVRARHLLLVLFTLLVLLICGGICYEFGVN